MPPRPNENVTEVAPKIFGSVGCALKKSDLFGSYRVRKGSVSLKIFVVKINDVAKKQQILKAKMCKVIELKDVIDNGGNSIIYSFPIMSLLFSVCCWLLGRKAVKG